MYSQRDQEWQEKKLGNSELAMYYWGCVVTAVAQALRLAGWNETPGTVVDKLNQIGGFTPDGLIIWKKVEEAYPQYHNGGDGYKLVKGHLGKFQHWVLEFNDQVIDPLFGQPYAPKGFEASGVVRTAAIDKNPESNPEMNPTPEAPAENVPPSEQKAPDGKTYKVEKGDSLWKIAEKMYGDGTKWPKIHDANKDKIENPDMIYPDQELIIPA